MTTLVKICRVDEIPEGEMRAVDIDGDLPLAVFNAEGTICVTSNICTHNIAMLTDGYFEKDIVECPLHGGSFCVRTGEVKSFPCETPLRVYPVSIEDGTVYINLSPRNAE